MSICARSQADTPGQDRSRIFAGSRSRRRMRLRIVSDDRSRYGERRGSAVLDTLDMTDSRSLVTVRAAQLEDADALQSLTAVAYRPFVALIGQQPAPMNTDYAKAIGHGAVWVAERDGELVGLIVVELAEGYVLLENVAVAPRARGTGVGSQLLQVAEDRARAEGLGEVRLYTNEAMTENLTYYPRHGYRETHRCVQDGFSRVFFSKAVDHERNRRTVR